MKLVLFVGLMICLSIFVAVPAFALETVQDEITITPSFVSSSYVLTGAGGASHYCVTQIGVHSIENTVGTSTLIHFDTYGGTYISHYAPGAPASAQTSFTLKDGATTIGSGTIGYQRLFDVLGAELAGYQYLTFSYWNVVGLSGNKNLDLDFDRVACPLAAMMSENYAAYNPTPPTGYMSWGMVEVGQHGHQATTYNKVLAFANSYSVSKGTGLGIVGTIWKYGLTDTTVYNSRAFVINATSDTVIAADATLNGNALHFDIPAATIYIAVLDANGNWHNTSTFFTTNPASAEVTYAITLNPTTITSTTSSSSYITAMPTSALLEIRNAAWSWDDATGSYDFYESGNVSRPMDYTKVGSTWYGYEVGVGGIGGGYTRNMGASLPNPRTLSNITSSGEKLVTCFIGTSDGYWYSLTGLLTVSQGGMQNLIVEATDAYSNALVGYTNIAVLNKATSLWSNVTASGGVYNFLFAYNSNLYLESTATGYTKSIKNWTVLPYGAYILNMPMFPLGSIAATNVSLNVVVLDGGTSGVFPNVQVRLSDGQVKYTTGAGVANFNVSAAKSYQIIASYTGYNSATRTLTTGAGGTSQDTYLTLNRIVVTTAPTLPPGVTAVVTLDTRTNAQKDQAMMDQVREWGSLLIPVACLMTLLYMFGYKP